MQDSFKEPIKYIIGIVTNIIYENYKNPLHPFCVCIVSIQETNIDVEDKLIRVILHNTPPAKHDHIYKFFGKVENSDKYEMSFICDAYIRNIPIERAHVVEFLSSGLFYGIKRKRAEQIVETLGDDCLIKIVNSPEVLFKVKGISKKAIENIEETIIENLAIQDIITKLHEWNISLKLAKKIFSIYGDASVQKITKNPYCLANTVKGISFMKADEIAYKVNIKGTDSRRIKGAIEYALHEIYDIDGSTFANKGYVMQKVDQILFEQDGLHYPSELIEENLTELVSTDVEELKDFTTEIGQVRQIGNRICLAKYYGYEQNIAKKLSLLHSKKELLTDEKINTLIKHLFSIERRLSFKLSDKQSEAIVASMLSNLFIIIGGPGTGKSTIIKMILMLYHQFFNIYNFQHFLKKVFLLAPTGRAAKRMTEITEIPAQTIHHFLITHQSDNNEEEDRLFIIDEMSMMDISTMNLLINKLHKGDRIIFVGDSEQLPPIKAGNVFKDIIESEAFPFTELKTVFRQNDKSTINDLAVSIRENKFSEIHFENSNNVNWIPTAKNDIVKTLHKTVLSALKQGIPFGDIQIIAPIHRGEQGITFINNYMQKLLIKGEIPNNLDITATGFSNNEYAFYVGNRVIQLVNNSEKNVLNGDLGIVVGMQPANELLQINENTGEEEIITEPERLVVHFDKEEVLYYKEEMNELALAYCFSVHKAQGSEFPYVLLPVSSSHLPMMNRNLLYTAITRAKKEVTIIGELNIFLKGIEKKPRQRFTFLKEMLTPLKSRSMNNDMDGNY